MDKNQEGEGLVCPKAGAGEWVFLSEPSGQCGPSFPVTALPVLAQQAALISPSVLQLPRNTGDITGGLVME